MVVSTDFTTRLSSLVAQPTSSSPGNVPSASSSIQMSSVIILLNLFVFDCDVAHKTSRTTAFFGVARLVPVDDSHSEPPSLLDRLGSFQPTVDMPKPFSKTSKRQMRIRSVKRLG